MKSLHNIFIILIQILFICFASSSAQISWTKDTNNPVFANGPAGSWDEQGVWSPSVLYHNNTYHMWYSTSDFAGIGHATSTDGISWQRDPLNPVLVEGPPNSWDDNDVSAPMVIVISDTFHMWYSGHDVPELHLGYRIGHATSADGSNWVKDTLNPVLDMGNSGTWDDTWVYSGSVVFDGSNYHLYYNAWDGSFPDTVRSGHATSPMPNGRSWTKDPGNPVLVPKLAWERNRLEGTNVIYDGSMFHAWYTAGDFFSDAQIGYATSPDGSNWTRFSNNAVLPFGQPGQWDDNSVYWPSVIFDSSGYKMWYSGYDGTTEQIGLATAPVTLNVPGDYSTIQAAINAAFDGNLVLVADGTYNENINFKGKAITVASHFYIDGDTTHIDSTIIDGSSPSHPDSESVVSFMSGEDTTSILSGLTITGGTGTVIDTMTLGAGVLLYRSGGLVEDCRITQNTIEDSRLLLGGGISSLSDIDPNTVIIRNCLIDSNQAIGSGGLVLGGGIYLGSDAILETNFIQNNKSFYQGNNLSGSAGGGIYAGGPFGNFNVRINDNQILNNTTANIGGFGAYTAGMDLYGVSFTVTNNIFSHNIISSDAGGYGAGLRVVYGGGNISENSFLFNRSINTPQLDGGGILLVLTNDVQISNNYFEGNEGTWGGGIEDFQSINTAIENNSFINNIASNWGGALFVESNAKVNNNIMYGNSANYGGAIYVFSRTEEKFSDDLSFSNQYNSNLNGKIRMTFRNEKLSSLQKKSELLLINVPVFINNTIVDNTAPTGGGIRINGGSQPVLLNSILWGNSNGQIAISTGSIEAQYSDIQGGWTGVGNIDTKPQFVDTVLFELSDSSLCIGAGIDSIEIGGTWYYDPVFDFDGDPRPNPVDMYVDIGAQESPYANPTGIISEDSDYLPKTFALKQNYPNPFNPKTTIEFSIPQSEFISLKVYNLLGQEVVSLVDQNLTPGNYKYIWNASGIASGIYYYSLKTKKGHVKLKKLIILK